MTIAVSLYTYQSNHTYSDGETYHLVAPASISKTRCGRLMKGAAWGPVQEVDALPRGTCYVCRVSYDVGGGK